MNTRHLVYVAALSATLAVPGIAMAQGGGDVKQPDQYIGTERRQQTMRINVDVDGTDLSDVMERIGQQVARNILVDPNVQETVTVSLREIPWREAVDVIAKMTRCEVEERPGGILLLTQPPKVTIQFTDANVRTVLQLLAAYSGKNIIISPQVSGNVTLDLKEVHWLKALHAIVKTVGDYTVVEETEDLLRVVPRSAIETQLETHVFKLKYVRPPAVYRAVPPATSTAGNQAAATVFIGQISNQAAQSVTETFTLFRSLAAVITNSRIAGATMEYDEQTNAFIITATKPLIGQIRSIIQKVDQRPAQVYAEVKFVSTVDNNNANTGIEFNEGNTDRGLRWSNREHGPFPQNQSITQFSDAIGTPLATSPNTSILAGSTPVGQFPFFIGEGVDAFSRNFNLPAILNPAALDVVINLLDRDNRSRTIQSPSLFMLDNQDAVIFVGEQVPYATLRSQPDANGNITQTLTEGERSPVAIGFSLFIQPHVIPDSDRIIMTVIPRTNDLSGTTAGVSPAGFERFAFGNNLEISLPRTREQALVSHVMVDDTSTAVLGGLLTEVDIETVKRVPILSSIPIVGNLFTSRITTKRVENLTIFVTPTIVRQRSTIDSIFMRATRRLEKTDYFYNKYEKPVNDEEDEVEDTKDKDKK